MGAAAGGVPRPTARPPQGPLRVPPAPASGSARPARARSTWPGRDPSRRAAPGRGSLWSRESPGGRAELPGPRLSLSQRESPARPRRRSVGRAGLGDVLGHGRGDQHLLGAGDQLGQLGPAAGVQLGEDVVEDRGPGRRRCCAAARTTPAASPARTTSPRRGWRSPSPAGRPASRPGRRGAGRPGRHHGPARPGAAARSRPAAPRSRSRRSRTSGEPRSSACTPSWRRHGSRRGPPPRRPCPAGG